MKKKSLVSIAFLIGCSFVIMYIPTQKTLHTAKPASNKPIQESDRIERHKGGDAALKKIIDTKIDKEKALDGSLIGVSVRSFETGELIYSHHGKTRLNPASNMKLLTAAAALSVLGEDYTFPTEIATDGNIKDETLQGNLYIKGKGDPTLLPEDLENFADELNQQGIKEIAGNLIGDDTWYDDERLSPGLVWSDEDYYYGAPISALNVAPDDDYNTGSVIIKVSPNQKAGQKPDVDMKPDNEAITIKNKAQTTEANGKDDLEVKREHGTNTIIIEGNIPIDAWDVEEWMAVWDPNAYTLDLFKEALEKSDIEIKGETEQKKTPNDADVLFSHESMPLNEMLVPFMKLSNNSHAEVLVKEMGKEVHGEGSWEKGIDVMNDVLPNFNVDVDRIAFQDGSGISHDDLIPAHDISMLLYDIQDQDWFEAFVDSLPVAGETEKMVGGTLMDRLEDTSVQAKTGTINGVSSLAGYLETKSGEKLIFSILINHLLDEEDGPPVEDKIIEAIIEEL